MSESAFYELRGELDTELAKQFWGGAVNLVKKFWPRKKGGMYFALYERIDK